ncbi:MAG: hypothetical protein BWY63_03302 [Chloroflexi bacterium ADurb.Bin360]|nr:MAG: hypothetical protein BWY63_03302 [Chloroflexi bacterium ADurb.Bin360]
MLRRNSRLCTATTASLITIKRFRLDPLEKLLSLSCGFSGEFGFKNTATSLILRQGSATFTFCQQQAHQLAVRLLAPGFDLYQTPCIVARWSQFSAPLGVIRQCCKRLRRQTSCPFPLEQHPLLIKLAIRHRKVRQKIATVQHCHTLKASNTGKAAFRSIVAMMANLLSQCRKLCYIQRRVTLKIKLQRLALHQQEWLRGSIRIANSLAQRGKRLAQIVTRALFRLIGP